MPYYGSSPPEGTVDRALFVYLWFACSGAAFHELRQLNIVLFRGIDMCGMRDPNRRDRNLCSSVGSTCAGCAIRTALADH